MTFTLPSRLAAATTPSQSAGAAALADAEDAAEAPAEAAADCDAGAGFDCAGDGAVEAAWLPPQPASTMASRATLRDERTVDGMPFTSLLLSRSCAPYWNRPDHLSRSAARSSGLAELTAGNSCFQWKGRVASMIRRELVNSRRARPHGPQHLIDVVGIDVRIHHHDVAAEVSRLPTLACHQRCLPGMAGVAC